MTVHKTIFTAGAVAFMLGVGIAGPASAGDNGELRAGAINQIATIGGAAKLYQGGMATVQGINVVRGESIDVSGTILQSAYVNGELTMHNYGVSATQGVNVVQAGEPVNQAIDSVMPISRVANAIKDLSGLVKPSGE